MLLTKKLIYFIVEIKVEILVYAIIDVLQIQLGKIIK